MPTLLTLNRSFVLLPKVAAFGGEDVLPCMRRLMFISLPFFSCLNINLWKSCSPAAVPNLIYAEFLLARVNVAASCGSCEALDSVWPLCDPPRHSAILEVSMVTRCYCCCWFLCPRPSADGAQVWGRCAGATPPHYVIVCLSVRERCVIVKKQQTRPLSLNFLRELWERPSS